MNQPSPPWPRYCTGPRLIITEPHAPWPSHFNDSPVRWVSHLYYDPVLYTNQLTALWPRHHHLSPPWPRHLHHDLSHLHHDTATCTMIQSPVQWLNHLHSYQSSCIMIVSSPPVIKLFWTSHDPDKTLAAVCLTCRVVEYLNSWPLGSERPLNSVTYSYSVMIQSHNK